jgi:hypothetical protein
MVSARQRSEDPHWDLALAIAGKLWLYGEYVVDVDPSPTQRLVDLQWAAYQAGRIIGVKTTLDVTTLSGADPRVRVGITLVDEDGRGLIRAQDGLDALLRSVRAQQSTRRPGLVPRRRHRTG